MSKSSSHQFSGTMGDRIAQGMTPENLKKQIIGWAKQVVARMGKNASNRKRAKFNTACVAFDESTGTLYFGRNGGINKFETELCPIIKELLPPENFAKFPSAWNYAETDAINNALRAGASLEALHIYTINVLPDRFGDDKVSCENCTYMYKGRIKKNNSGWCE